ncbi:hypothetical protein BC830DRAFT_1144343 [Chytriomyces sp. MP71]|nr:hypothetical protein BC830DRAFT_1144343 [Chytriomyces sp. MP71]
MELLRFLWDPRMQHFDCETLVTSPHITPLQLLSVRTVLFLYAFVVLVATISTGTPFYGYFTDWTLLGINMYLLSAIINSAIYIYAPDSLAKMNNRSVLIRYMNWLLYVIPATCCYIVSIVYWTLIYPKSSHNDIFLLRVTCSQHAANSIIMIIELMFARVPLSYGHLPPFLVVAIMYLGISEIFHMQAGIWAYNFLDTSKPFAWAYYLGVSIFFVIVFFIMTTVHFARDARRERLNLKPLVANFDTDDGFRSAKYEMT